MTEPTPLPHCPSSLAEQLLASSRKVLLFGETGIGKSTLAVELARQIADKGLTCLSISADPGLPGFGLPGTVSLGHWQKTGWKVLAFEALCTLDAGRFRLPLLSAVAKLIRQAPQGFMLIDSPGVTRSIAGSELLTGFIELLGVDTVLVLNRPSKRLPLLDELLSLGVHVLTVPAHPEARSPSPKTRAQRRTEQWQVHLADYQELTTKLADLQLIGSPPPVDVPDAWPGRQCAFIEAGRTVGFGEIVSLNDQKLHIRLSQTAQVSSTLLIRDACSDQNGLLTSVVPFASGKLQFLPPPDALPYPAADYGGGPRPAVKLRGMYAILLNGVFGDPLLHLRLPQRSLLFDLGDSSRLPMRIAHQVSDIFISHAHIDHIGGFLWLLRSRVGSYPACRLFGPPGLSGHIKGMIAGILWDRIGESGPRFEIAEIHGDRLKRTCIQTGRDAVELSEIPITDGLIVDDPLFTVRTVTLDHHTPVQAYAFESKAKFNVNNDAIKTLGLSAGPWLNELKRLAGDGKTDATIDLPDRSTRTVKDLAELVLTETPGEKLVYATDLADTLANRADLSALAQRADFLFCEAAFLESDIEQAQRTGHLTARACGEIASQADVKQLVPFHFSKRYEKQLEAVYEAAYSACLRVVTPAINGSRTAPR
ncbi:MAG: hypothetical protein EPO18_00315 [Methylobacter sp.]|nr:MAG: hypothetical protein EPO18_00315 [Methylobacter sp.]